MACDEQAEVGDGESDCEGCQLPELEDGLSPDAKTALALYNRVATQITYDLGIYPPPLPMRRDKAERMWTMLNIIHDTKTDVVRKRQKQESKKRG